MIWVETQFNSQPVTFIKGSPIEEDGRLTNENQHETTLTRGFYLGRYEVTQAEYYAVMLSNEFGLNSRPSSYSNNLQQPVESVSWDDIQRFLTILNEKERSAEHIPNNWSYTLPTEAEWEYSCRAGTITSFHTGNTIENNQSNFRVDSSSSPIVVGNTAANAWGFFDMHGNVREWCSDWYFNDFNGSYTDPLGPTYSLDSNGIYRNPLFPHDLSFSPKKICRGGSFKYDKNDIRSARRFSEPKTTRKSDLGFRLALRRTDYDAQLEYATANSAVAVHSGNAITIETIWEDTGKHKKISAPSEAIAHLFEAHGDTFDQIEILPSFSTTNSELERLNFDDKPVFEKVPRHSYYAFALSDNFQFFEKNLTLEQMYSFFESTEGQISEYLHDTSGELDTNFTIEAPQYGFLSLLSRSFAEKFALFLEQGNLLSQASGWMWAKWFGYYYGDHFPWVFHENLGWSYIRQDEADNAWLYRKNLGWAWTTARDWWADQNKSSDGELSSFYPFPYLYRYGQDENDTKVWTYLSPNHAQTTFYDFDLHQWFKMDQPYLIDVSAVPTMAGTASGTGEYYHWEKVSLSATVNQNYKFLDWSNNRSTDLETQFFASSNLEIQASFLPIIQPNQSGSSIAQQYKEILSYRDDLTDVEKEKAYFELLFYGNSPTAGIQ